MKILNWLNLNTREYLLWVVYWALMIIAFVAIGACALSMAAGLMICLLILVGSFVVYPDFVDLMSFADMILHVLAVGAFTYILYLVSKFSYERIEKRKWWRDIKL